jgi:hypothetical protein
MLAGTRSAANASRTALAGRGGLGRLKAANCCSKETSSALVLLLRISIFQVPLRSMAAMAVLTVACVASQLKMTRQPQAMPITTASPNDRRTQSANTATGRIALAMSSTTPTA